MDQVLFGGDSGNITTGVKYYPIMGDAGDEASDSVARSLVSTDGVIKYLRVRLIAAPGVGTHRDFTLYVNGAPTALTLEIADANTLGSNMVNEIDVTGGDAVTIHQASDGATAVTAVHYSVVFEGDADDESLILGACRDSVNSGATEYSKPYTNRGYFSGVENDFRQIIPTAGTISNLYVQLDADPGTNPDGYRFTLRLGGATVAQSLIVTITADATTGNDLAHNLVVAPGDVVTMMIEPLNTPSEMPDVYWGMTFTADIAGEAVVLGSNSVDLDPAATEYAALLLSGAGSGWWPEANARELGQACHIRKLYVLLSAAPGAGNSYDFTIRAGGGDTNITVHIHDADTIGDSGDLLDTITNDEYVSIKSVPISSPIVVDAYWGFVVSDRAPEAPPAFQPGHLKMTLGLGRMGYDLKTRGGRARRRVG